MDTVRRKRRDFFQNIAIVVLMLSAVALFVQTQLYNLNQDNDYFRSLSAGSTPPNRPPPALPICRLRCGSRSPGITAIMETSR